MMTLFYRRFAPAILVVALVAIPFLVQGSVGALRTTNNDVRQWLPQGFAEARQYDWFLDQFGSEEMVVVSWPGCTVDDERLERMAAALTAPGSEGAELFRMVRTGPQVIQELMGPPLSLSRDEALERMQGSLVGPNGRTSALVARVSEAGEADRPAALAAIYRAAEREVGLSRDELRVGGPTVDSVALDEESARSRMMLTAVSVLVALALAWRCLRHVRLVGVVFITAVTCAGASLSLVHFTGGTMNLLLVMMPPLIYVTAISGAIHIATYYRSAVREVGPAEAPARAMALAWWPCFLAAATTAVGLGSLVVSDVVPVRMFGLYAAAGVMLSLGILFLLLPSALQLWPVRPEETVEEETAAEEESLAARWSPPVVSWIAQRHRGIVAGAILLLLFFGIGVSQLNTSVKVMSFFSPESKIIRDYAWLEQHLGPLVPVEVVVRIDGQSLMPLVERLELVRDVQHRMESIDKVGGTMSAATFAPVLPTGEGVSYIVERRIVEEKLQDSRGRWEDLQFLRTTEDGDELWRVSARVEALNAVDYGRFVALLREEVDPVVAASAWSGGEVTLEGGDPEASALYTGVMPLLYKAQRQLLADLQSSFLSAFVLIGLAMMALLRGLVPGLLSMLPNVVPIVLIFGGMGWLGIRVGIGTMMTASLALGIAVDATIHYLSWFRRALREGQSRPEAIEFAFRHCASAMIQTTLICGVGLLVFAFSEFLPTARFAWMMFALLVAALVGDLLLLPALLSSGLGRFFDPTSEPGEEFAWPSWKRLWGRSELEPVPAAAPGQLPLE